MFYSVMKQLVKCFNIVFIDIIGMAGSSRPDDFSEDFSPDQIIDYFVGYMERWRIAMSVVIGKLKLKRQGRDPDTIRKEDLEEFRNFIISGHSFGGYIAGFYTLRYP
jgi:pimeloyl-ACP methyl ester carboxylesterase